MLTAEMDAPVAANGHAAEIDILLGFLQLTEPGLPEPPPFLLRPTTSAVGFVRFA